MSNGILLGLEDLKRLDELRSQGLGTRAIARALGRGPSTIRYHLLTDEQRHQYILRVGLCKRGRADRRFQAILRQKTKLLSDFDRGYLSGLIDGDGYLGLMSLHGKRYRWQPRLDITSTSKELIDHVYSICGTGFIHYRLSTNPNAKPSWDLHFSPWTMRWVLPQLTLCLKRRQAEILLEALNLLKGRCNSRKYEERLLALHGEMKILNKRGNNNGS